MNKSGEVKGIATIPGSLRSEIVREFGKGDKYYPDLPDDPTKFELGPIFPERPVEITAWLSTPASRASARQVKITAHEVSGEAPLYIEAPPRYLPQSFNKHYGKTLVLFTIVIFLHPVCLWLRHRRKVPVGAQ